MTLAKFLPERGAGGSPPCCRGVPMLSPVSQDPATPRVSPAHSPPENGIDKARGLKKGDAPNSPASVASSSSTPSSKTKDLGHVRPSLCQGWGGSAPAGRGCSPGLGGSPGRGRRCQRLNLPHPFCFSSLLHPERQILDARAQVEHSNAEE